MSAFYRNCLKDIGKYAVENLIPYAGLLLWFHIDPWWGHLFLWSYVIYGSASTVALLALATWMASKEADV